MSQINIAVTHEHPIEEAHRRVKSFEEKLKKFRVKSTWSGYRATVSGPGLSGNVRVDDRQVSLVLKIGMVARAAGANATKLKPIIEQHLRDSLNA